MECQNPKVQISASAESRTVLCLVPRRSDFGHSGLFEQLELVRTKKAARLDRLIQKIYIKWSSLALEVRISDVWAVQTAVRSTNNVR